jgi:hypothetical protein
MMNIYLISENMLCLRQYLTLFVAVSSFHVKEGRILNQELEHVLLMNILKVACELQEEKLNVILKDGSNKSSVRYLANDWS